MRHALLLLALLPGPLHAACQMDGARKVCVPDDAPQETAIAAKFLSAPVSETPSIAPGDPLPQDALTVIGTEYLGLPPARDGWAYFRVGRSLYRADFATRRVINRVSP